jgi:hypothetical protein
MMTFSEYVLKENAKVERKMDMISEDSSNVPGISDQLSKFWKELSAMMNSKSAATSDVSVEVYEYHWDEPPKKMATVKVIEYTSTGFTAKVPSVGEVKFGKSGRASDTNLDLFALSPKFVARR